MNLNERPDIAAYGLSEFQVSAIIARVNKQMRDEGQASQIRFDALFQQAMDDAWANKLEAA